MQRGRLTHFSANCELLFSLEHVSLITNITVSVATEIEFLTKSVSDFLFANCLLCLRKGRGIIYSMFEERRVYFPFSYNADCT